MSAKGATMSAKTATMYATMYAKVRQGRDHVREGRDHVRQGRAKLVTMCAKDANHVHQVCAKTPNLTPDQGPAYLTR